MVQLIDVVQEGNTYRFDFRRLRRWVQLADRCGVQYIEMAHFFTQWGAAHCPKIVAQVEGRERKIFGWKDRATGVKYRNCLDQFLPQLVRFIRNNRLERRVYFHVSDEPSPEHLASYSAAASIVYTHLQGFPCIDALSDVSYYDRGLVRQPIPASNHIEPFVERGIKNLWTYYCVSQWDQVANRFFTCPLRATEYWAHSSTDMTCLASCSGDSTSTMHNTRRGLSILYRDGCRTHFSLRGFVYGVARRARAGRFNTRRGVSRSVAGPACVGAFRKTAGT